MRHGLDPEVPEELGDRVVTDHRAVRRREDQAAPVRELARVVQDFRCASGAYLSKVESARYALLT